MQGYCKTCASYKQKDQHLIFFGDFDGKRKKKKKEEEN